MDNVSNTTRSRDSTAGSLCPKGEKCHVHKDGHFGITYVSWHDQYGQCHGGGQAFCHSTVQSGSHWPRVAAEP